MENELRVRASAERVWAVMLDLGRITSCLPGLQVEEVSETGEDCRGSVTGDVGPFTVDFQGGARIASVDEEERRVVYRATGEDANNFGVVTATSECTLAEESGSSLITVVSDLGLPPVAEQFGGGIVRDIMDGAFKDLAACLERELTQQTDDPTTEIPRSALPENGTPEVSADEPASPVEPPVEPANGAAGGATVEGTVIVGRSPSEAAASARTTDHPQPQLHTISTPEKPGGEKPGGGTPGAGTPDGAGDRTAALKKAAPALAVLGAAALVLFWLLRRSARRTAGR